MQPLRNSYSTLTTSSEPVVKVPPSKSAGAEMHVSDLSSIDPMLPTDNLLVDSSGPVILEEPESSTVRLIDNSESGPNRDYSQLDYAKLVVGDTDSITDDSSEDVPPFSEPDFDHCYSRILRNTPSLKTIITEDSATMYKQMIAWTMRCGLTGAMWTAGYTLGAVLDKADPTSASKSKLAWVGAGIGEGLAEMLCVLFIGYYLSDPKTTFKSNSNRAGLKQNLMEGAIWGASCIPSGTLWQPALDQLCSSDDLSHFAPSCMAKVGASTGASFAVTLACLKALLKLKDCCLQKDSGYFRPFNVENTISDSLLFGMIVCGTADAFFVLTSTDSPFNYRPYSGADQFELMPTLTQMGFTALSTMLGGLAAFALRGGISSGFHLYDQWGDVSKGLRSYVSKISLNSQCVIL